MFDFIRETRAKKDGLYNITLEIPYETYKTFYNDLSIEKARDILTEYLKYRQDDARISDVKIDHNKNTGIVNIYANLHYLGNDKTIQKPFVNNYVNLKK
ncbi:MAG TPA: hypothetical protein GX514_07665 [Thermoanaerobacterales bacterium]|nr:hypothetical protein [Thermoanaerobacterales bacterium]